MRTNFRVNNDISSGTGKNFFNEAGNLLKFRSEKLKLFKNTYQNQSI